MDSEDFYRDQAARLTHIARQVADPQTKAELLDIAAQFLTLADYAERRPAHAADD